ncbi:MAG: hypothetical protein AMXMBFR7_17080 [Planctomycetota bacterium]
MAELRVASWHAVRERLQAALSPESFDTWFQQVELVEWDGECLKLAVRNRYVKQWIEDHYRRELLRAAREVEPETRKVELHVQPAVTERSAQATAIGGILENVIQPRPRDTRAPAEDDRSAFERASSGTGWRLDDFVQGACNRLAYSAARSLVDSPATAYNPLFLHGDHGLGKTHLLQGLERALRIARPNAKVKLLSCEAFANEYLRAVQDRKIDRFRETYRSSDVLLVDDVQFLVGKEKTQEEFLYTFDALVNAGKQVVLTADQAPRTIKELDARLLARFQSGLVVRLDRPDYETRVELIQSKAVARRMTLPLELAELLAMRIDLSVRELEGAVCKLSALAAAEGRLPDREMASLALRELGYLREGPLSPAEILEAVAQRMNFEVDQIRGAKRHAGLVQARHLAMFLCKQLTSYSLSEIGRFFGNRDHSTVLHAVRKMDRQFKKDEDMQREVQALRRGLGR